MTMRPNSIRARMTTGFALFIALLMLLVSVAFYSTTRRGERHNANALLSQATLQMQQELKDEGQARRDVTAITREASNLRVRDLSLLVVNAQGRVIAHSKGPIPSWPLQGDEWIATSFPSGNMTVTLALPWNKTERTLRERALLLLGLSTLVVAASAAGAWFLVGRTLSPIDHLARQALTASAEKLRVQLEIPSADDEIARLVATLNDLLARIEQTASTRGRFYAAASHELRTPLQALTGHLEVALSRKRPAEDYEMALSESHAQATRLTTLVQDLLLLNQLDADTSRPPATTLDLADICEIELSHLRILAERRGLNLELSLPANCEITAPRSHATMLVRNLLENAVKYSAPSCMVHLQIDQHTLIIRNECSPTEGWDEDKYFEPFFRPDASRNSPTGGNGLGLAICKAICQSNGWDISLREEKNSVCVSVRFGGTISPN